MSHTEISGLSSYIITGLCFLAFLICIYYLDKRDQRREARRNRGTLPHTPAQDYHAAAGHPSEHEHRSAEQAHWKWQRQSEEKNGRLNIATFIFYVLATIVAALAFGQTWRQANITQYQLDEAHNEQRPWIQVTSVVPNSVQTEPGVFRVSFTVNYKNIGHSPATHMRFSNVIMGYVAETHSDEQIENECVNSTKYPYSFDTVLPDESGSITIAPAFDSNKISQKMTSLFGTEKISSFIDPSFSMCLAYAFGSNNQLRTGFTFHLGRSKGHEFIDATVKTSVFNIKVPETIVSDGLVANVMPFSKYAY